MADPTKTSASGRGQDSAGGVTQAKQYHEKRQQLVEAEYGLKAIRMQLAAMVQDLESLESLTVTSLLARIKGDRSDRIRGARQQVRQVQDKLAETADAVDALRREVEESEQRREIERTTSESRKERLSEGDYRVSQPGGPSHEESAGGDEAVIIAEDRIKIVRRAAELCEEARKGVMAEMETAGRLDKCNVAAVNAVASGLLGATTDHARKEMGQRVRNDVRRLLTHLDEAIAAGPSPAIAEELDARAKLARFAEQFDGRWFARHYPGSEAVDELLHTLELVDMLLERRLNDARNQSSPDRTGA